MPLLRDVALIAFGACIFAALPARASTPLELAAGQSFELLVELLEGPATDPRWQCSARDGDICPCVELRDRRGELTLGDVDTAPNVLRAGRFLLQMDSHKLQGLDLVLRIEEGQRILTFSEGISSFDSRNISLRMGEIRTEKDLSGAVQVHVEGLSWFDGDVPKDEAEQACDDEFVEVDAVLLRERARAASARVDGSRWTVESFRVSGMGAFDLQVNPLERRPSGFLPPTLRVHEEGAQVEGSYFLGTPALSIQAFADSDVVGGVGIAHWTDAALCREDRCHSETLSLNLFADLHGPAAVELIGESFLGTPRRHASLSADGVSWAFSEYRPGRATRLERDAFFQPWRAQRAGLTTSGKNYDLYLGANFFSDSPAGLDIAPGPPPASDFWLHYGTRVDLGAGARADIRLQHHETKVDSSQGRISGIHIGIDRLFGSPGRIFLRPSIRGDLEMGVLQDPLGARAGSSGHLDLATEAGIGLRGSPASIPHYLSPRVFLGRRVIAADELPARVDRSFIDSTSLRRGPKNFLGTLLDQRLTLGDAWLLETPVGLIVMDDGAGRQWDSFSFATLRLSHTTGRPVSLGVDGVCRGLCDDWGLTTRIRIRWTNWLESLHFIGRGLNDLRGVPYFDHRFRGGVSHHLWEPGQFNEERSTLHATRIRTGVHRWSGELGLFGGVLNPAEIGGDFRIGYRWPELGWGLAARMAALPHQRDWATTVGLSGSINTLPAF